MVDWSFWLLSAVLSVSILASSWVLPNRPVLQRSVAAVALLPLLFSISLLLSLKTFYWYTLLLFCIELFLIFVAARALKYAIGRSTAINAMIIGAILVAAASLVFVPQELLLWTLLVTVGIMAVGCAMQLTATLRRYRLKEYPSTLSREEDLPTVSVCIPARNEDYALNECLQSVLDSDYPKIEVIVLDDCSQDTTSQLIKSFAHDGVRFVRGEVPSDGWLGRNQACEVLASQASGQYLLYMGVDTRLEPQTISHLMNYVLLKRLSMVSVLPQRRDISLRSSVVAAPLRYFSQMILPQTFATPASTALWIVSARKLREVGGFSSVRNEILPENIFARLFDAKGTYRYIISNVHLGAYYAKKWRSQIDTSVRLLYPMLHKQPYLTLIVVLCVYLGVIVPAMLVLFAALSGVWPLSSLVSLAIVGLYMLMYMAFAFRAWRHWWFLGGLLFTYAALQEVALILTSMIAYEFGRVDWKGRNVCYPVLRRRFK